MIYFMLTAMRMLVVSHDFASPLGPLGERFADHGYDVTPVPGICFGGQTLAQARGCASSKSPVRAATSSAA
jgi:hypothetical protein